jgi:hypothetical protein
MTFLSHSNRNTFTEQKWFTRGGWTLFTNHAQDLVCFA